MSFDNAFSSWIINRARNIVKSRTIWYKKVENIRIHTTVNTVEDMK